MELLELEGVSKQDIYRRKKKQIPSFQQYFNKVGYQGVFKFPEKKKNEHFTSHLTKERQNFVDFLQAKSFFFFFFFLILKFQKLILSSATFLQVSLTQTKTIMPFYLKKKWGCVYCVRSHHFLGINQPVAIQ